MRRGLFAPLIFVVKGSARRDGYSDCGPVPRHQRFTRTAGHDNTAQYGRRIPPAASYPNVTEIT